jgi:hypothetical protein
MARCSEMQRTMILMMHPVPLRRLVRQQRLGRLVEWSKD